MQRLLLLQLFPTKEPAPNPKCKLVISSLLRLPPLLDSLICTRNAMSIALLLQRTGKWDTWVVVVHLYLGVDEEPGGAIILKIFFHLFLYFILMFSVLSCFQSTT